MRKRFYAPGKIQPGDEYVVFKGPLCMGAITLESGQEVDVSNLSRTRIRQLVEWKRIIPKRLYEEVSGFKIKEGVSAVLTQGSRGKDLVADVPKEKVKAEPETPDEDLSIAAKPKRTFAKAGRFKEE